MADPEVFMDDLDHGGDAVGRARRRADEVVCGRVVAVVVAPHHDVESPLLDRRGHDDLADAAVEVGLQPRRCPEAPGAFQHDVDTMGRPGHRARRVVLAEADRPVADPDGAVVRRDFTVPPSVHRVVFQQVGRALHTAMRLVDVHDVELRPVPGRPQRQASHASETVDADGGGHRRWSQQRVPSAHARSVDTEHKSGRPWQQSSVRNAMRSRMPSMCGR